MRVLHQGVVFENGFPIFLISAIGGIFTCELFDVDLVAVEVLKNQVAEIGSLNILAELNVNVGLTGSRGLAGRFA